MAANARRIPFLTWLLPAILVVACSGSAPGSTTARPSAGQPTALAQASPRATAAGLDAAPASNAWLVVGRRGGNGTEVIVASTGEVSYRLPDGVPNETWGRLVGASTDGSTTTVRDLVVQPGFGGDSQSLPGAWRLPTIGSDPIPVGVSEDRRTIVLVENGSNATAGTSQTSRFAVVRGAFDVAPRLIELAGQFDYDALSPDGSTLFVVEHLAGPPTARYQVRMVDVASGRLRPEVVADKTGDGEAMAGYPVAQTRMRGGMVFTLYRGADHPFIHALSSVDGWALCIDLPASAADDSAVLDWGLAALPDGGSIVAVNATVGLAARVSTGDLSILRTVSFAPTAATGVTLAKFGHGQVGSVGRRLVAAPHGGAVYAVGASGVVRLSSVDLTVSGRLLDGWRAEAEAVTPDGRTLYVLLRDGRIVGVDTGTGKQRLEVPGSGYDRLLGLAPFD